mmetsp:Transcript_3279/g.5962  ORF Transcript_3279/g.5962 Transcript_3279/m.5962 type:complete len:432 (-) Transcript_3279:151-1446(-)
MLSTILLGMAVWLPLLMWLPVDFFILPSMRLEQSDQPVMFMPPESMRQYSGRHPTPYVVNEVTVPLTFTVGPLGYMLIIEANNHTVSEDVTPQAAGQEFDNKKAVQALSEWYSNNEIFFQESLNEFGGVLFRNFNLRSAEDFDKVFGNFHSEIGDAQVYVGTAPRKRIENTRHVSSASEIKKFATIPTHLELPYTPVPPRRIYFFAQSPNTPPGGQTVLTDFREVWRQFPEKVKAKVESLGMSYERWYFNRDKGRKMDVLKTKSWQDMFDTTDKAVAESLAAKENFTVGWNENEEIRLTHDAVCVRNHQHTGDEYWSTHFNVLHGPTFAVPFAWSAQIFQSKQSAFMALIFHAIVMTRAWLGYGFGHNMLYGDGSEIAWDDAMEIRRTISRQSWIYDHQIGDLVMLDNHRLAHGRTPWFSGDRTVLVALYH